MIVPSTILMQPMGLVQPHDGIEWSSSAREIRWLASCLLGIAHIIGGVVIANQAVAGQVLQIQGFLR